MKEIVMPFGESFAEMFEYWKIYKSKEWKFKFKSAISEQMCLNKLVKISGGKEDIAIQIIEESIANGWQGLFPLKQDKNVTGTTKTANAEYKSNLLANAQRNTY